MNRSYTTEELNLRQEMFMERGGDKSRFVIRKLDGTWYGVASRVEGNVEIPFSCELLLIDEDAGEIEEVNPVDVMDYLKELGVVSL